MEGRELPVGWAICTLGTVLKIRNGYAFKSSEFENEGVPLIRQANLGNRTVDLSGCAFLPPSYLHEYRRFSLEKGDILIGMSGSIGKISVYAEEHPSLQNQRTGKVVNLSHSLVDPAYLLHFLSTIEGELAGKGKGLAVQNVSAADIEEILLSLAPLNEQRRIAAKLDTTLAAVEACRQRLDGVAAILKRFRQAVLAAATSGELTREWREETGAPDWFAEKASSVCAKVQSGGTPKEGFIDEPGIPFLKVYNLVDQQVDFNYRPQFLRPEAHLGALSKSRVKPGDILMNIVGPPLGKVATTPDEYDEWNINQTITLFRPSDKIRSGWIYFLLCEGSPIREIELRTKGSAGQVNISLTQCREFDFPVPSINEQDEIVDRVESLFTLADQLEVKLTAACRIVDRLTPALLAKAFRGELVPQDPNDEPASVLLERIRAAREAEAAAGKPSRRGRRKAAANPEQALSTAAPAPPDLLAQLLQECGALSERALLAASELDPAGFRAQLALEQGMGVIRETVVDGQVLLEAVG